MFNRIAAATLVPIAASAALAIPALGAGKTTIKLGDNFFEPATKTVKKGTKVTWDWTGMAPHDVNVVSGPQKFRSDVQTSGTYTRKLTKAGVYKIVCSIHPGMDLTLKVR